MRIVSVDVRSWTLPLHAPFVIAQRTAYEAQNVWIEIQTENSQIFGIGASAPVSYVTGESVESVLDALTTIGPEFVGLDARRLRPMLSLAARLLGEAPSARAGLEMALYDLWAKHWNIPLWQHFGGAQETLTTDMTIPIVPPDQAGPLAQAASAEGFRHLKIKVGDPAGTEADLARIESIVQTLPQIRLRIDANQAFTAENAITFVQAVLKTGAQVEMIEQPVPKDDLPALKYVKDHVSVPVYADEAACSPASVVQILQADAADGINVKLMKSGLAGALEIIDLCHAAGKGLMLGCMLESGLGIAAAAQIAGGTGAFNFLDLDSHRLLAPIPTLSGGFFCAGDQIEVGSFLEPGWGVVGKKN